MVSHHIPQAKNIPYQPLLIKPIFSLLADTDKTVSFKISLPVPFWVSQTEEGGRGGEGCVLENANIVNFGNKSIVMKLDRDITSPKISRLLLVLL